ncbi:MAG: ABC-F family ATP-binding cassette domain-containing protein [Oscillospiraceae bacterium]|nr:ABC-F family ATP-binding cassette domain-containing protein [Oscillospiraceae bacterium]
MLFSFENITKYFGDKQILDRVSAAVNENDRIGIIGRNGTGKTTLLNILCEGMSYDEGELSIGKRTSIGYLKQNSGLESDSTIKTEMRKIFSDLLAIKEEIYALEQKMSTFSEKNSEEYKQISDRYAGVVTDFEQRDGYNIDVKIKTVLNGMGFADKQLDTVINTLSGGERTRLSLARLLLLHPDVLVLDEPTNHLDFETLIWLEEYLESYKGAVITVSHDRFFLDKIVTPIWEIEDPHLNSYKGNYSKYLVLKEEKQARQLKEYEEQQKKIADLKDYVAKNLVRASTSKSAQSRRNTLEKMEIVDKPKTFTRKMSMKFDYDIEPNFEVLKLDALKLEVGEDFERKTLCDSVSFTLERGDKLAVMGANGTGKTTLLRAIKNYPSINRSIKWGGNVKIGYYDQHLDVLNPENTVMEELWSRFPSREPLSIRTTLGRALFSGDSIEKKVGELSGGEKARLSLAILMEQRPNVLIMDEPTNHLDLPAREMLEKALFEYSGTLIIVSHDRYFLEKIPNKTLYLRNKAAKFILGGYNEALKDIESQKTTEIAIKHEIKAEKAQSNQSYRTKQQRALDAQRRTEISRLEKQISALEARIKEIEQMLSTPDVFADYQRSQELCNELENAKAEHEECLDNWLVLSDEADS